MGFKHKQPDLTILEWRAELDLCIDVRGVTSAHKTPLFSCLIQVPNGRTHSNPALHTLSPAHHARISKHREYVQSPLGEADLDGGNNDKTPEEQRTLKQIILSDIQGDVVFLPAASSSGGGVSPDISSLLKSLASIALRNGKVLDSNPLQLFLKTAKRKISAALMKAMAVHMSKV